MEKVVENMVETVENVTVEVNTAVNNEGIAGFTPSGPIQVTNVVNDGSKIQLDIFPTYELEDNSFNVYELITIPPPHDETLAGGQSNTSLELVNQQLLLDAFNFEEAKPDNNIDLYGEEDVDPSEDEEDDPEEMIFAEDLEAYLNENEEDTMLSHGSGSPFHSTHQSLHSSSSMANRMGGLDMNPNQGSKSSSSKRKTNDGDDDTASSSLMGSKKLKI